MEIYFLLNLFAYLLTAGVNAGIDLPPIELRINAFLIVGAFIGVLILLLSLKIYQMESSKNSREYGAHLEEKKEKGR
jgi:hypothetical protein